MNPGSLVQLDSPYHDLMLNDYEFRLVINNGAVGVVQGPGNADPGKLSVAFCEGQVLVDVPTHWVKHA